MPSLTQAEAVRRAALLAVDSYAVELDLTRGDQLFGSVSRIRFRCHQPGESTFVELTGRPVAATLNGAPIELDHRDNRVTLPPLAADNELVVIAEGEYTRSGEGLHRAVDPADGEVYLCASSAPDNAQRVFACFDQPDLKATVTLSVTAPAPWTVLGNGAGTRGATESGSDAGAVARWEFEPVGPMSVYLFTVCAGTFHSRYREHDGIGYGWHCRASLAEHLDEQADELFTLTERAMDWYQRTFAMRYPFGAKYDQVFVPEFLYGAMENIGCVTVRDEWLYRSAVPDSERQLRAMVIAHEMAHMWFGDLVTLRWWDDLWLNESFAEFLGFRVVGEVSRYADAWGFFGVFRKLPGYQADQGPATHPVAPTDVPDVAHGLLNIDAISYPKGASALRQLAALLGEDTFFAGLRAYFSRYAYRNATLADLIGTLSEVGGVDLTGWADRWLRTTGVDVLTAHTRVDAAGRYSAVEVARSAPAGGPVRPHRIRVGWYPATGTGEGIPVTLPLTDDPVPVPELVGRPAAELLLLNDADLTFARVDLTPAELDRLGAVLPAMPDAASRAVVWTNAWELVRAGRWPAERFVELAATALPAEPSPGLPPSVLRLCERAADTYLPAERRDPALRVLAGLARVLLAGPHRLLAASVLARCAVTDEELELLADWRRGERVPEGVPVDAELRWSILFRLATLGLAGPAEIDAELTADHTAAGEVAATRCRAALPDVAAKRAAWQLLMADRSISNRHLAAVGEGFWRPEHAVLTDEYVPRYFAELPGTAAWRSPGLLLVAVGSGYPSTAVSERTARLGAELLARDDLAPMLRRKVVEADHEIHVALAARAAAR
ncbi:aminopeptidase [Actinocatenispora thailandica]|uniref:Aminopeptidase N n=1 Tax=Actinocatenispora thailandica TaxID=227318 RepID=A0A7R7HWA5_9ACTN|nr:aminopeptidase N [Actinocatenispora thailandica]BCJ33769.1 aminopeptidase [Actinocatenispora thailandica]